MTSQYAAITLNLIPGLGSIRIQRLMEYFGSPEIILHADARTIAQVNGIGATLAQSIASWKTITCTEREMELAAKAGAKITTLFDDDYPSSLRTIYDPPIVLYSRGEWKDTDLTHSVSIVGSRQASPYGRLMAQRFSYGLAEAGISIISGLAMGIDTQAHQAALDASGRTIAIIGSGLNQLYPSENRPLAKLISEGNGAVISEFPMDLRPGKTTFPMRNRVISGWSSATLVIEAPSRSGSLITAHQAMEQGRHVFAVPGPADRHHSDGCHELIRSGAILATKPQDLIEDLGWGKTFSQYEFDFQEETPPFSSKVASPVASYDEQTVIGCMGQGFCDLESLSSSSGFKVSELTPVLAKLQIKRQIEALPGGYFKIIS